MKVSSTAKSHRLNRIVDLLHLASINIDRFFSIKGDPKDQLTYAYLEAVLEVAKAYFYNDSGIARASLKDSIDIKNYHKVVIKVNKRAMTLNQISNYLRKLTKRILQDINK